MNQDALGIQAKRIFTTATKADHDEPITSPDKSYITDCNRIDILAKPLADGSLALSFFNLSQEKKTEHVSADLELIKKFLGDKLPQSFYNAKEFNLEDLWSGKKVCCNNGVFAIDEIEGCGNITYKITPSEK